ncbi:hypothetical protein LWC33_32295 [Pseudonocardia sp. RS11V-5]|uniref:AMP-binding enzyme n=1 Tax=Pseudonocardia terrae TaxID=2905831 RepID=UPI001E34F7A2|nr:hypothetical protein [Pseudonocardia terrae]MCE3556110.1 hypothetical protein [Pseudonocardia terrae]
MDLGHQLGQPEPGVLERPDRRAVNSSRKNAATHPAVASCAVIGVPDEQWSERVHAVVVRRSGQDVSAEELREHVKARIAGYEALRSAEFVDALPISAAGNVLKRELRAAHWAERDRQIH